MTTIAAPAVQTAVAHIVARILERAPTATDAAGSAAPAPGQSATGRPAPGQPGRPAGRPTSDATPGNGSPTGKSPAQNGATPNPDAPADPDAPPQTATPSGGTSVILSALLSLATRAVTMDINLNQLLTSTPALKSPLPQLPAELLSRPQVIEAVVLRNTLLPSGSDQQQPSNPLLTALAGDAAAELPTNYRVALQWQNRVLQFISPQPLPTGRTVQLQVDPRGEVLLLPNANTPQAKAALVLLANMPATAGQSIVAARAQQAGAQLATTSQTATRNAQTPAQVVAQATTRLSTAQTAAAQLPSALLKTPPQQTLQQSLRETLPRQQALNTLVPLLQKLLAPAARAQLPEPVAKQLAQLLQSLPKPNQLQTGAGVKRALENSGSFLESRIVRSAIVPTGADAPEPLAKVLETDLKAQMSALLAVVRRLLPDNSAAAQANTSVADDLGLPDELIYSPKMMLRGNAGAAPRDSDIDAGDLQLAQLSKLLQSGLARIQLNQLDGAVSRHANTDPQLQVPTWVLELPMANRNGHHDNLQLRIEQHGGGEQQQTQKRVQWNVQISFDLHALGKISAQLSIVEKNVAATVWAEHAQTHRSVQEKIDYLRAGLESVGVRVTDMQCRLGVPPERAALISQQLVDVRT